MNLKELNEGCWSGELDSIALLEDFFILENGEPIRFEPWQREKVLEPVFRRGSDGLRVFDTYLIGLGKKNGKSTLAAVVVVSALLFDDPNPEVIGAAGDKDQAKVVFNYVKKAILRSPKLKQFVKIYRDAIERVDGAGVYRVISSDAPTQHGSNASAVIFDELWTQSNYELWEALIHSPARKAPFHFVISYAGYQARPGIPLFDLYQTGQKKEDEKLYCLWLSGEQANPASWVTKEYLERQRRRLPEAVFRRIHLNQWVDIEAAAVFNVAPECWAGAFESPQKGAHYVAGIDLAKYRDYTAWAILRTDKQPFPLVNFGRFPKGIDYVNQAELLVAKLRAYNSAHALVDRGAAGAAVIEMMQRQLPSRVDEFVFTGKSKPDLVTGLATGFEQREISMPGTGSSTEEAAAVQALRQELANYVPDVTASGNIRYSAAPGHTDDIVSALALAYRTAKTRAQRAGPMVTLVGRAGVFYIDEHGNKQVKRNPEAGWTQISPRHGLLGSR